MRRRLDVEMVRRGLATTRTEAALAIRSGQVAVAGRPAAKASTLVLDAEPITMRGPARRFVSRGGEKLEAALDRFEVHVAGASCLDAGASTGGFTDCLLSRGAAHVIALDVGYGQLDWRLREEPRVTVLERRNVRDLRPGDLPYAPSVVTADLSFISLSLAAPAMVRCAHPTSSFVVLVKPQFEAGRDGVGPGGVVTDPGVWRASMERVAGAFASEGATAVSAMASPLLGPAGNAEFLLLVRAATPPADGLSAAVEAAVEEASRLVRGPGQRGGA